MPVEKLRPHCCPRSVPPTGQQGTSKDNSEDESKEEPPWASPEPKANPAKEQLLGDIRPEPYLAAEEADAKLKARLGYSPQQSWGDIRAQGSEAADKQMAYQDTYPNGASFEQDEKGLENAYNNKTSTGVFYDPDTRTEYIKGSSTPRDWRGDISKIPVWVRDYEFIPGEDA